MILSGQGPLYIGDWDARLKTLKNQVAVGCATRTLQTTLTVSKTEIKESCSGLRQTLIKVVNEKKASVNIALQQFDKNMLAMALFGTAIEQTGSTVTDEVFPTVAVGDYYHTKRPKISMLTITDSDVSPVTLVADVDYHIDDADYGRIVILDIGSYVQPFKASYTYGDTNNIKVLDLDTVTKGLIFDGVTTADDGTGSTRMRLILPKVDFPIAKAIDWISDDVVNVEFNEAELLSAGLGSNDVLGNYGLVELL